jgi:signal transduction histidine kinase
MLLAFAWWTILLNNKNEDAFTAKKELLRIALIADNQYEAGSAFFQHPSYINLKKRYERRQLMIFGESLVFVISLFIGFWFINKGYRDIIHNSRTKTNFLLSISHELKSPVASVKLALETILKRDLSNDQIRKISAGALTENTRLGSLIENLLLATRLEEPYELKIEDINLNEIIQPIINNERLKHPDAIISLNINEDAEKVRSDRFALQTIFINLIENALKYSPDEKFVEIDVESSGLDLIISISDKGIGIPENEKLNVFEKFYRLGAEITRKTKGTGLGLFIISKMIKALDGNIRIEDNDPVGSVFIIYLKDHLN